MLSEKITDRQNNGSAMDAEEEVQRILALIAQEKQRPAPDKGQLRKWHRRIVELKEDWRVVYTGQNDRFRSHTSTRGWRDDCDDCNQ